MTNIRSAGADDKVRLAPPIKFSLEEALEYIQKDEYVEVTPKTMRLRKIYLDENERKRMEKSILVIWEKSAHIERFFLLLLLWNYLE